MLRAHPHLYEVNTLPWLDDLSCKAGEQVTLGRVPDAEWDLLHQRGIDIVFLMGIWKRSPLGRQTALGCRPLLEAFDEALPGWTTREVAGSAYCVAGYEPDSRIGTWDELAAVRRKLHERDMRLLVDFVPNHTAFDHPWIGSDPDRYVQADLAVYRDDPAAFRPVEDRSGAIRFVACGRDPYFPPWTDVAQLDYSSLETRAAMISELQHLSRHADGARCDMAMLALSDVFGQTWQRCLRRAMPDAEFWAEARAAVPGFLMLAEVYWDLEWRLQQLGFDYTYDKRLYDRLRYSSAADVRGHLTADAEYQRRSARFIENHDEVRSAAAFDRRIRAAATVVATLPGLRFFHQGQFEGRTDHVPVQMGRWRNQPADPELAHFYDSLLAAANSEVFHSGSWRLLDIEDAGSGSSADLIAWQWSREVDVRIVVVNLGDGMARGRVTPSTLAPEIAGEGTMLDEITGHTDVLRRDARGRPTLEVELERGGARILRVAG
jgi:hypothetical protein